MSPEMSVVIEDALDHNNVTNVSLVSVTTTGVALDDNEFEEERSKPGPIENIAAAEMRLTITAVASASAAQALPLVNPGTVTISHGEKWTGPVLPMNSYQVYKVVSNSSLFPNGGAEMSVVRGIIHNPSCAVSELTSIV